MSKNESLPTELHFTAERDRYGRSTHALREYPRYRTLGYVVRLPKVSIAAGRYGDAKYFVNNWLDTRRPDQKVTYHRTLAQAKAALVAQAKASQAEVAA